MQIHPSPSSRRAPSRRGAVASGLCAMILAISGTLALPTAHAATAPRAVAVDAAAAHPSRAFWLDLKGTPSATSARGTAASLPLKAFRSATLDRASMVGLVAGAPHESTRAARLAPLTISLPAPDGTFQRFALIETSIMEPGLAAKHPDIKTYSGKGIDDATATMVMSITSLGLHASVRGASKGPWYIEPYYQRDDSLYASYYARDLSNVHGTMFESMIPEASIALSRAKYHGSDTVNLAGSGFTPNAMVSFSIKGQSDSRARQVVHATADIDGTVSASFIAEASRNVGVYEVTATDGKQSTTSSYSVVDAASGTDLATGPTLRNYRLALVTDPSYATYFGADNVTAAKVVLMNRVNQVYTPETSIRMILIANNDLLNFNTVAAATGTNGPCGSVACYTAAQIASCTGGTLTRNRQVVGMLIGAANFDIGHIGLGVNGGGVASLGVVGGTSKAQGCTGIPTPVGDFYAVDYVAHEMGHEFAGNHTFNGTISNCSTSNRNAGTSVEPGSGSSVMAYAGICGTDNLQPHSDAYWSERSFDEITTYTSAAETNINEVQMAALTGFATDGMQFQLNYNGVLTAPIIRGANYTVAGIKAAVEAVVGGTVTASAVIDGNFTITYAGTLAGLDVTNPTLVNCSGGCTGFINDITKGGATTKNGITVTATGNSAPIVTTPATYTIPVRTPFVLTGSATDVDNDPLAFMWEQNDRGATGTANGTGLITQPKLNGPLFRQFGTAAIVTPTNTILYNSPGENIVSAADSTRVFPDMAQILANNTNAETGSCPLAVPATPTLSEIDCFSEFLPTATYVGTAGVNSAPASLNFRLTARDGKGGVGNAATQVLLAPAAGPFLVTSPNTAVTYDMGSQQVVTWSVASTDVAPVSTSAVKITLSADGGATFPYVLAASTANSGQAPVTMPAVATTAARIKVEAVGNIFFDVSNANFTLRVAGDLSGDGIVNCDDLAIVKAAFGKRVGQAGYSTVADVNGDGVVDARDLAYVAQKIPAGTVCR